MLCEVEYASDVDGVLMGKFTDHFLLFFVFVLGMCVLVVLLTSGKVGGTLELEFITRVEKFVNFPMPQLYI